jgi:diaminopimelate epimerase
MIAFTKMQALGNDFVVVDATQQAFCLNQTQIQQMADRRRGVGFDQLLVLAPPRDAETSFYYRIFNADGTEVGQCGNGARCMTLFIAQQQLNDQTTWILQTSETQLTCRLLPDGRPSITLAPPQFAPEQIPYLPEQPASLAVGFGVVNVGNPHAIIAVDNLADAPLSDWGQKLANDARFPEGVNVSIMAVRNRGHIDLRVYERGVGETQACGSAACAAMVFGQKAGLLDHQVRVTQPGGDLEVSWQGVDFPIEMSGEAEFVFVGEYQLL